MNGIYSDQRAEQLHKEFPNCHTVILINDDTTAKDQLVRYISRAPRQGTEKTL